MNVQHLISVDDLSIKDVNKLMENSKYFAEISKRPIKKVPALQGKTIVCLFYESSTRTRLSFELAAKRLSADVVNIAANTSAIAKGESFKDTTRTLNAMDIDAIIIRHPCSGTPHLLKSWLGGSVTVINAGDGTNEHPTQAMLDLYTLKKEFGNLAGMNICIMGDISHSRVARSVIKLFSKYGLNVSIYSPRTMIPFAIEGMGCKIEPDIEKALKGKDVIYLLRLQLERGAGKEFPSIEEYSKFYGINEGNLHLLGNETRIMHPGPVNRGVEISSELADLPFTLIARQVESGIEMRMAILFWLLTGEIGYE